MGVFAERQKVEIIGVFEDLLGKVGLKRRQRALEIGLRLTLASEKIGVNLVF